jgi:Leucine-rich repeat (LRR) protein
MSRSSSNSQNRPNREKIESFQDDDFQSIMNSIINEEYIRRETGADDIEAIIHLNLVIDTAEQSVFELSEILPNLKHLILDHSNIASIRDLGIGLRFLTSLSLSSCSLYDIDGIGVLTGLQELCLSDNYLTDVTPLAMHENIQVRWFLLSVHNWLQVLYIICLVLDHCICWMYHLESEFEW